MASRPKKVRMRRLGGLFIASSPPTGAPDPVSGDRGLADHRRIPLSLWRRSLRVISRYHRNEWSQYFGEERLGPSFGEHQAGERRAELVHLARHKVVESYVVNTRRSRARTDSNTHRTSIGLLSQLGQQAQCRPDRRVRP